MTFAPAFDTGFGFLAFEAYNKNFTARIFGDGLGIRIKAGFNGQTCVGSSTVSYLGTKEWMSDTSSMLQLGDITREAKYTTEAEAQRPFHLGVERCSGTLTRQGSRYGAECGNPRRWPVFCTYKEYKLAVP